MKIIISYRREDSDAIAGRIRDRLASRYGNDFIFQDIDSIPFGGDIRQHIQEAFAQGHVLIAIIGPQWLGLAEGRHSRITDENDPVRIEVETALQRSIPIIPLLIGAAKMPNAIELPDSLKKFAFLNAAPVDSGRDFHQHMERLFYVLDGILQDKVALRIGRTEADSGRTSDRRLAAVAFVDIVGYTILMASDETRTHQRWMIILSELIAPQAEKCHGTLVKSTGDGVLVEFPSAHDAVEWAREVQRQVTSKQTEHDGAAATIRLRVAVHLGDVITTDFDVFGDGVNVAARLQEHAVPGGIVLSEAVYDLVRGTVGLNARDLGFLQLKNFAKPIRAYSLDPEGHEFESCQQRPFSGPRATSTNPRSEEIGRRLTPTTSDQHHQRQGRLILRRLGAVGAGAFLSVALTLICLAINFQITGTAASQWIGDDGAALLLPAMAVFGALLGLLLEK